MTFYQEGNDHMLWFLFYKSCCQIYIRMDFEKQEVRNR